MKGYQEKKERGMPYPLIFLILPIILHSSTRQALPRGTRTKLHIWLQRQPEVRAGFGDRTRTLVPYVKEALIFGMQTGIIRINEDGEFTWVKRKLKSILPVSWSDDTEPAICCKKAEFIGRWFAQAGEVSTIYTMWGICP